MNTLDQIGNNISSFFSGIQNNIPKFPTDIQSPINNFIQSRKFEWRDEMSPQNLIKLQQRLGQTGQDIGNAAQELWNQAIPPAQAASYPVTTIVPLFGPNQQFGRSAPPQYRVPPPGSDPNYRQLNDFGPNGYVYTDQNKPAGYFSTPGNGTGPDNWLGKLSDQDLQSMRQSALQEDAWNQANGKPVWKYQEFLKRYGRAQVRYAPQNWNSGTVDDSNPDLVSNYK